MIDRILKLLEDSDITAKRLTELLEVSPSTISEWKKRKTKPSVEHVRRLAVIFDVSTDYIINGKEKSVVDNTAIDRCIDYTMLDVYSRLTTEHRDAVRDFLYMCLKELEKPTEQPIPTAQPITAEQPQAPEEQEDLPDLDSFLSMPAISTDD